ncbi:MAG TPA: glycerophosphodiester phosphodiesterase family protein [Allosphingosinicella sp.]|uniref:glycerophosphodiester phosphodiesterase family protein n=1 Tax=Allosphingosinicella sp. TaxID=2823234 RepID=UPI002F272B0E
MTKGKVALIFIALVAVTLSLINASWLAPTPPGRLKLVAHRGVGQQYDHEGVRRDTCTATRIHPPEHNYLENTVRSMQRASTLGAHSIELDMHPTTDGHAVVFHDWTVDCRTNGKGVTREHSLAELKKLDIGYGYTADGGRTFPLRGAGIGAMPTVEEVLQKFPNQNFVFNFKSKDPRDADILAAAFGRAGVTLDDRYSFYGHERVLERMRKIAPGVWIWSKDSVKACALDYLYWGWTGWIPESCRNGTVVVPLNYQWAVWGWPNRFQQRMASVNARVIVIGEMEDQGSARGIERPEQLGEVPRAFKGYLWVDDMYGIGRALGR